MCNFLSLSKRLKEISFFFKNISTLRTQKQLLKKKSTKSIIYYNILTEFSNKIKFNQSDFFLTFVVEIVKLCVSYKRLQRKINSKCEKKC